MGAVAGLGSLPRILNELLWGTTLEPIASSLLSAQAAAGAATATLNPAVGIAVQYVCVDQAA
jgi:hypothetical protein